jgi:hypothetical protein
MNYIRFKEPITLHQTGQTVLTIQASDGWLIVHGAGLNWTWIRRHDGKNFLDNAATWVPDSLVAETIPFEYPDGTVLQLDADGEPNDHLYPERYP